MGGAQSLFEEFRWDWTHRLEVRHAQHFPRLKWRMEPSNSSGGGGFDAEADAACVRPPASLRSQLLEGLTPQTLANGNEIGSIVATGAADCRRRCEEAGPRCNAAHFQRARMRCVLHSECLQRTPAADSVLMHRRGPSWPRSPGSVRWRTNASLVIAHYAHR
eukprot:1066366-Prymnesium_polylepis.3